MYTPCDSPCPPFRGVSEVSAQLQSQTEAQGRAEQGRAAIICFHVRGLQLLVLAAAPLFPIQERGFLLPDWGVFSCCSHKVLLSAESQRISQIS